MKLPTELHRYASKPSKLRIAKVFSKTLENGGKSIGQAMREVGYSESMARNPQKITRTKVWIELVDKYLPENEVLREHSRITFKATKIVTSPTNPDQVVPDNEVRLKAIALAYKIKGKLNEQPQQTNNVLILPPELIEKYREK